MKNLNDARVPDQPEARKELLIPPCKFCGNESTYLDSIHGIPLPDAHWIACPGCASTGPQGETELEAIELYTRPTDGVREAEIEKLKLISALSSCVGLIEGLGHKAAPFVYKLLPQGACK